MKLIALSLVLLAGCARNSTIWRSTTPEERAQLEQREQAEKERARTAYLDSLKAQCSAFGFQGDQIPGCIMQLHQMNLQTRIAGQQARAIDSAALLNYSQGLLQMGQPRPMMGTPSITCRTFGNMTTCQ